MKTGRVRTREWVGPFLVCDPLTHSIANREVRIFFLEGRIGEPTEGRAPLYVGRNAGQ
jgi:hypothetical protein